MEAAALFERLSRAHPRSVQVLRRAFLDALPREDFEALYGVKPAAADALISRSLADAQLTGEEANLTEHREVLTKRLDDAARAWATSPDRARDEKLRWLAIAVVLALSAWFYWRPG